MIDRSFYFFILFFALKSFAVNFDSKTEVFVAQNKYNTRSKFAKDGQTLFFLSSDNKLEFNKNFEAVLSPEVYYFDKFLLEPKAVGFNFYTGSISTTLGFFQMKKEGPDILDPLDYQQPKNYLDPLHSGKLSLLGLKTEYAINSYLTFVVAYIPQNRIPIIPDKSSPWYPRKNVLPTQSESFLITLPENPYYEISNGERTSNDLKDNYIFKTKIVSSYVDIVLMMAETLSSSPDITPTLTGTLISASPIYTIQLDNPIALDVRWKKVKNYGGGLNIPLESLGLILKLFSNQEIDGHKKTLMTTLALEKSFNNLTLVVESTAQQITNRVDNSNLSTMTNLYENAQALGIRYAPTDKFSLLIGGLYDSPKGSYVATLRPKYYFTANFYTELQFTAVGGKTGSLLSYFEQADSASLKLGTSF